MSSAASETYRKVPFEWTATRGSPSPDNRPDVTWAAADGDDRLVDVVADALAVSPDVSDQRAVAAMGAGLAARELVAAPSLWRCSRDPSWWQLILVDEHVAGFILPVTFDDSPGVGTIFHVGVRPTYRGRGLGRLLLRRATRTLLVSSVHRVFCDTASTNEPMIHLFQSEGWTRLPERDVVIPDHYLPHPRGEG